MMASSKRDPVSNVGIESVVQPALPIRFLYEELPNIHVFSTYTMSTTFCQISWLRWPRTNAKEIASTFRSYVARPLHFVANDKKGPFLLPRFFLG